MTATSATATATALDQAQLTSYREDGHCVVRGLFSTEEVAAMTRFDVAKLQRLAVDEPALAHRLQFKDLPAGGTTIQKIEGVRVVDPDMGRWSTDPRLMAIAEQLMGEPARLFKDKYILKPKGGGGFGPHQDLTMGFHRFATGVVSMMIALDPADADNGALQLASIRHTPSLVSRPETPLDPRLVPTDAWQLVPLQPGDVAIFDGLTPHRSEPNQSEDRLRRVYITTYNRASEGDVYHDYYAWYFSWQRHSRAGGQRIDYGGEPHRRSLPGARSFTRWDGSTPMDY